MDKLDAKLIASMPRPVMARMAGGGEVEVHDFEVECGLMRFYSCGLLVRADVVEALWFRDGNGVVHDCDLLYLEK